MTPGLVPYSAHKGSRGRCFTAGVVQRGGEPGDYGQQRAAGSDRHGFESRRRAIGLHLRKAATALGRYGSCLTRFAALVAFVAGPESSYITGANLTVDGGNQRFN